MDHVSKKSAIADTLEEIIRLSGKKLEELIALYQLSIEQGELISAENSILLNEVLDKKQLIIDNINRIDKQLEIECKRLSCSSIEDLSTQISKGTIKELLKEEIEDDPKSHFAGLHKTINDIRSLLKDMVQIDNANSLKAERYFGEIRDNIQGIYKSKRAFSIYNNAAASEKPVFLDKSK